MPLASFVHRKDVHTFHHCIVFFPKIKEIFSANSNFFAQTAELSDGHCQKTGQGKKCVRPEDPNWLQKRPAGAKIQHGASGCSQQRKGAEFPVRALQQELETRGTDAETICAIQYAGTAGKPQPKGPQ